jgi:hypothetical protein
MKLDEVQWYFLHMLSPWRLYRSNLYLFIIVVMHTNHVFHLHG